MDSGKQEARRKNPDRRPKKVLSPKKPGSNDRQRGRGSASKDGPLDKGRQKSPGVGGPAKSKASSRPDDKRKGKADVVSPGADEIFHAKGTDAAAGAYKGTTPPSAVPRGTGVASPGSPFSAQRSRPGPSGPFTPIAVAIGPPPKAASTDKTPFGSPGEGFKSPVYPLSASRSPPGPTSPIGTRSPEGRMAAMSPNKMPLQSPRGPAAVSPAGRTESPRVPWTPSTGHTPSSPSKGRQGRSRSTSIKTAAVLAMALVAILLLAAVVAYVKTRSSPPPSLRDQQVVFPLQKLQAVCTSDGCRTAVASLNLSMDTDVPVCKDVYAYVCGRWRMTDDSGSPTSYLENLRDNYARMAHVFMMERGASVKPTTPEVRKVIDVYLSCNSFFAKRTTELPKLWEAASLNVTSWLAATHFSQLFNLIVETALSLHLLSALRIYRNGTALVVRTGLPIETGALVPNFTARLIKEATVLLQIKFSVEVSSDDVLQLADKVTKIAITARNMEPQSVTSTELDMPSIGVEWKPVVDRVSRKARLVCVDAEAVRKVLAALASARQLKSAAVYGLLVPVAAFMSLEYKAAGLRESTDEIRKHRICLGNVEFLFEHSFYTAMSEVVKEDDALRDALEMWKRVQESGSQILALAKGVKLNEDVFRGASLPVRDAKKGASAKDIRLLNASYGGDFVSNLVQYVVRLGSPMRLGWMLLENHLSTRVIPAAYVVPDFYYAKTTEISVNYGTLGAHVAEMLFNQSFRAKWPQDRMLCFVKHAKEKFDLDVEGRDVEVLVRQSWVMEATSSAVKQELEGNVAYRPLLQLFYLRFARTYCGENVTARALVLRFAARKSTMFAEIFGCPTPERVNC